MAERKRVLKLLLCFLSFLIAIPLAYGEVEKNFIPPIDYTGDMYFLIKSGGKQEGGGVGLAPFHNCSFKILWGPWETEAVEPMKGKGKIYKWMSSTMAITFKKKKKDQVPLTVKVTGCIPESIELHMGRPESNIRTFNPDWRKRLDH